MGWGPHAGGAVGIPAVVALEDLALIGNMAHHPRQELQGVQGLGPRRGAARLVRPIGDRAGGEPVRQPAKRHRVPGAVAGQPGGERPILGWDPHAVVHVKARVRPGEHALGGVAVHQLALHQHAEHRAAERFGHRRHVVQRQRHERAVRPEAAVGDQQMEMGVPVGQRTVRLDRGDDADRARPLTRGGPDERRERARRDPRQVAEQGPVIEEVRPQALGDREHDLAVRHRGEQGLLQPNAPQRQAFGVTAGTEVAALAGEGQQVLVPAAATAHPGEPVRQDAAGQELLDHVGDDAPPGAPAGREPLVVDQAQVPETAFEQAVQRGGARAARPSP